MAKFKVRLKVTGFELEVEGSREDVPLMTESIGQQFAGMLQPAAQIVEGELVSDNGNQASAPSVPAKPSRRSTSRRRTTSASNGNATAEVEALNWVHDTSKWGSPQQSWVTSTKSIWLLYVAQHETGTKEMSSALIANTFNKHFQQAKRIQTSKVSRDLGRLKTERNSPVSENTTQTPTLWFLTQTGLTMAQGLVQEALGTEEGNNSSGK